MVKNITIWTLLEPLLYSEEYLHLEEIARKLKKNHSSLRKYLNFFEKERILEKKIKGRLTMYKINYSNPHILNYLTLIEKERLIEKCKKDLLLNEVVNFLQSKLGDDNLGLIFGSAVLDAKKANDLDLLIKGKISFEKEQFEKKFNVKFHIINVVNLSQVNESLKKEIKNKHLVVYGSEEMIRWLI